MAVYTQAQLESRIAAIDTELEKLLLSTATGGPGLRTPLDYKLGSKSVDITSRVEALERLKKSYQTQLEAIAGATGEGPKFHVTVQDIEMDRFGNNLGVNLTGED